MRYFFICILFLSLSVFGQSSIQKANIYFELKRFDKAFSLYMKSIVKGNDDPDVIHHAAVCAQEIEDYKTSTVLYELLEKHGTLSKEQVYDYCKLLARIENFARAKTILAEYLQRDGSDTKALMMAAAIDTAIVWKSANTSLVVTNNENLNSVFDDFAPARFKNGLVFCSTREEHIIRRRSDRNGEPFSNIFLLNEIADKEMKVRSFTAVNTDAHEGAATFTGNYDTIFFSRNDESNRKNHLKLYSAIAQNSGWQTPSGFMLNDSTFSFAHPSISADGNLFFFASDMQGGYGGTDIYVCIKADSNWSLPINLGAAINTLENEIFPHFTRDGHLYFSSQGHIGMGGYDVFISKQSEGEWLPPVNMKPPINSGADDFGFIIYSNWPDAYFSSNRKGGMGKSDIYHVAETGK